MHVVIPDITLGQLRCPAVKGLSVVFTMICAVVVHGGMVSCSPQALRQALPDYVSIRTWYDARKPSVSTSIACFDRGRPVDELMSGMKSLCCPLSSCSPNSTVIQDSGQGKYRLGA